MSNSQSVHKTARARRLLTGALLGAAVIAAVPGAAFAKEVASGGTVGPTTCSPISSLVAKADASTSDTSVGSIQVSYGVKACTAGQVLTATASVAEYLNPVVVAYSDPSAPLNGKFTLFGVRTRVTYTVTITAYDAATGGIAGSQTTYVAAVPRRI